MAALCFVKIDRDVAVLPGADDSMKQVERFFSVYDKLIGKNLQFLVYVALVLMASSVAVSLVSCVKKDSKVIAVASHVTFALSALYFVALLIYSMQSLQIAY